MVFLALFFLGILQGLTEFLPVSSSGHLVLFSKLFKIEESLFVSIILHLATLLSIVVVYRKEILQMILHPLSEQTLKLVVATIPTCIIVLILMPIIKNSFGGAGLPLCFFISAILLFVAECFGKKNGSKLGFKSAIFMGIAQGFAVFPGVSRSGSTISAGLLSGGDKKEVAKFSFLMSIPIILLSLVMEIYEISTGGQVLSINLFAVAIAFVVAFVVGIFAIKLMVKLTERANLKYFAIYLLILSVATLFIL